jgi:pyruvate/2-oxoacid:ferredoxin oxidoreductase beta subunit/Pyruvate/2-oxoacid:ferredoxin oxidoreductase gamma subunit
MTDKVGPLPFCPGCGHHIVTKALDKALVRLQKDPKEVVIVTDIGCIGLADRHFITNAFHGLHGRSITYGCGLKLARPDLTVIVIQGDGGCGIGGTHLLNVARRNIGVTLIVANNFNYGMTGGQHSVTTPADGLTSTTPMGNIEGPMDLCATAAAAGASWVYRVTMFDKNLDAVIARAIEQPGFAMLDIWELCTAYYSPRNQLKMNELLSLLEKCGFTLGQVVDKPRPEYSERYRQVYGRAMQKPKEPCVIEPIFPNTLQKQTGIIIAGGAGQKIKSAATIFGQAAMLSGLEATQKDDYPITVMTGHSVAEVILSPERIDYTAIDAPDYLILLSEEGLAKMRARMEALPETCVVFADESLKVPPTKAWVLSLPFEKTSRKVDRLAIATVALASLVKQSGMFPLEALTAALSMFQKPAIAEKSLAAARAGFDLNLHQVSVG